MHNNNCHGRLSISTKRDGSMTRAQARMLFSPSRQKVAGQALAELIIACAILAITLFGIVTTINFSINSVAVSSNKTRATYYAQDGLEQARAARNANWSTFQNGAYLGAARNVFVAIPNTIFRRRVTVGPETLSARRVTSTVTWVDGTQTYTTQIIMVLANR